MGYVLFCIILAAMGLGELYSRSEEKKQVREQEALVYRQQMYLTAMQTVFYSAKKYADSLFCIRPQIAEDIRFFPEVVYMYGVPIFQFKLTKAKITNTEDREASLRIQRLLQEGINSLLRDGTVPNIPGTYWEMPNGYQWPIFTIVAVQEDALFYHIQVAVVDNNRTANLLYQKNFAKRSPKPTSANDPDY